MEGFNSFYSVLSSLPNFEIKLNRVDDSTASFRKIGQIKISQIHKLPNDAHKRQLEDMLAHFTFVLKWSPFHLLVYENPVRNYSYATAFVTFTNNDDHLGVIKFFDNLPFNGRRLTAKPNGFTDLQYNINIGGVRFREQQYGVEEFNNKHYSAAIRNDFYDSHPLPGIRNRRISTTTYLRQRMDQVEFEDWDTPPIATPPCKEETACENSKRLRESESTDSIVKLSEKKSKVQTSDDEKEDESKMKKAGRFERHSESKYSNDSDEGSSEELWLHIKRI